MRLINADELIADFKLYGFKGNALAAVEFVNNASTVTGAVIPVRCCECERYENGKCRIETGDERKPFIYTKVEAFDFCSKGVKKGS